jgi:5-hydroxyisourate hydrolase-like protein (transthyretin family)
MKITLPLLVLLLGAPCFAVPLSVSVVDSKGAPVAGADVQFHSILGSDEKFVLQQTGADGRATFEVGAPKASIYGDLAGQLLVFKAGFALGAGALNFKTPAKVALLTAGAPIGGTVVDEQKKPVAGARVSLFVWRQGDSFPTVVGQGPLQTRGQATTGASGKWTIGVLPPGVTATVLTLAPGFAQRRSEVASGERAQIALHRGARIRGRLLGLDGKPLSGIKVNAQATHTSASPMGYGESTTGKDGTFDLDGLEAGTYNVMFQTEDDAPYVVAAHEEVQAQVGPPVQLPDSRAASGVLIGGKITERGTGKGIAGAQIGVYGPLNPSSSAAVALAKPSDENGMWSKRTLPGESKVYLYGTPQEFVREQGEQNLTIAPSGERDLNFELSRASKITGRLVDENGRGVQTSAFVFVQNYEEFAFGSDENGIFSAFGPVGGKVELARSRWNHGTSGAQWDVVGTAKFSIPSAKPLEIKLKRAQLLTLELGVFDQDDRAIEGAKVVIEVLTKTGRFQMGEAKKLVSDKTGRIHLDGIRSDQSVVINSASKDGYDAAPLPKIALLNGVYGADITLKRRGAGAK